MPKILSCDDSKTIRVVVSDYLTQMGFTVVEACNGQECLEVARLEKPDLILLDVTMPVMDGVAALRKLKEDPELRGIPVIMLTAVASRDLVLQIIQLGVKDYIMKPFDQEQIRQKVTKVLRPKEDAGSPSPGDAGDGPRKLLVIDDKPNVLQLAKELLEGSYRVLTSENGPDGLALAQKERPDLVLLDLSMPDMDGFQVFQKLRSNPATASIRVVGMSIGTAADQHAKARDMGFARILIKPFVKRDLDEMLGALNAPRELITRRGDVCILTVPDKEEPTVQAFLQALATTVNKQIENMAEEGLSRLAIDMGGVNDLDVEMVKRLLSVVARASALKIQVRLVQPKPKALAVFREFQETKNLPMLSSLDEAVGTFAS
jgi:two-component system cell cycle response regulator